MAYKQNAGRDDLTNLNISALTNGTDPNGTTRNDLNKTLYQANETIQDVKANGIGTLKPAEALVNPTLSTFRPRGQDAYKSTILSPNKDIAEFPGGVPASFSKGKGSTPYLNSRFIVNPPQKSNIANTMEEQQSVDVRKSIGKNSLDVEQYNKVQQAKYDNQVNYRNDGGSNRVRRDRDYMGERKSTYDNIVSGQTTSRENMVTNNKPLSTAWNPNTTIAEDNATFAADQKPGNMGFNQFGLTIAQEDKAQEDLRATSAFNPHPTQVRPAEKAAKRSSKVAKTLEQAFKTGSESSLNKAIGEARSTLKTDKYFSNVGNSAYKNEVLKPVKNQVTYQHEKMIENYEKASSSASKAQDASDQLTWKSQDIAKDITNGKFSLNSNNSSNSNINTNNLFKNSALTTDVTDGNKKRFKF